MAKLLNVNTLAPGYKAVGISDPEVLNKAVRPFHHAAQFIAMAGKAYLAHMEDDSHINMSWDSQRKAYTGRPVTGSGIFSLALDTNDFSMALADNGAEEWTRLPLAGKTREEVLAWLQSEVEKRGLDPALLKWDLHYDIPEYEYDKGKPYEMPETDARNDLAAYRSNANIILGNIALRFKDSSEVRIWPHHFDSGIFIPYAKDEEGNVTKGIYAGWNIADEHVPEPYFYITFYPWDHARPLQLPGLLSKGYWHTEGFYGIFLKSTVLASIPSAKEQLYQLREFFDEGIDKAIRIMNMVK